MIPKIVLENKKAEILLRFLYVYYNTFAANSPLPLISTVR